MNKEVERKIVKKLKKIDSLIKGAREFVKLVLSMEKELYEPNMTIVFVSGMVGFACQAASNKKNPVNSLLLKLIEDKIAISGETVYNYLFQSKESFYNLLSLQFHNKLPNVKIPSFISFYFEVGINYGNKNYLIENKFNPEKIFDIELYSSTWIKFYDKLIKYCETPDEWPILFSIVVYNFLEMTYFVGGKDSYSLFFDIALKNAIYVSKIPQMK